MGERERNPEQGQECGPEGCGREGERRIVFPWKFCGTPANFVSIGCTKMLLTFWKVKHCKGAMEGVDGQRPKRSNKHKQQ